MSVGAHHKKPKVARTPTGACAPGIELVGSGGLIRLEVRSLALEHEVADAPLPDDTRELLELLLAERRRSNESRYNTIVLYLRLRRKGPFWLELGYKSLEAMLAVLDLPVGDQLAMWEDVAGTFTKETFVLVGVDVLNKMQVLVRDSQRSVELRRRDYQAIFDAYARKFDSYSKPQFIDSVKEYLSVTYWGPAAKAVQRPARLTNPPQPRSSAEVFAPATTSPRAVESSSRLHTTAPVERLDGACPHCASYRRRTWALVHFVRRLEVFIRDNFGARAVPPRPSDLSEDALKRLLGDG